MSKKFKPRRSPEVIFHTIKHPIRFYLKHRFRIKQIRDPLPKDQGPYFLIGHHVTAFDAPIAGAYASQMIRFIAGDANYDNDFKKFWLDIAGAIPFTKNTSDVKSIMRLKRLVKHGKSVGLYPEGGRNWDGSTDSLIPATAKLIKTLKIPVYRVFYYGGYLSKPRWAQYFRKGLMEVEFKPLLTLEAIKSLTIEEIEQRMVEGLAYNEYEWQRNRMIPFPGKRLAEHVERMVYMCPECQDFNCFTSEGHTFSCKRCGATYTMNVYGFIENCEAFDNLSDWNQWQHSHIPKFHQNGFQLSNTTVPMEIIDKSRNSRFKGLYDVVLSPEAISLSSDHKTQVIPIKDIKGISVTFLDVFEMYVDGIKYRITFDPKRHNSIKLFYDLLVYMKSLITEA